jgi:hypothetical protein
MADETPTKHIFQARLFQQARVNTETFEIEAANAQEAKNRAEAIAKDKGLTDYDFEFTDLTSVAESSANQAPSE